MLIMLAKTLPFTSLPFVRIGHNEKARTANKLVVCLNSLITRVREPKTSFNDQNARGKGSYPKKSAFIWTLSKSLCHEMDTF